MPRICKEKESLLMEVGFRLQCPFPTLYSKCFKDIHERPETKTTPIESILKRVLNTFLGNFKSMCTKRDIYKRDCIKPKNFGSISARQNKPGKYSFISICRFWKSQILRIRGKNDGCWS